MNVKELRIQQMQAMEHYMQALESNSDSEEELYCSIPRHAVSFLSEERQLRYWEIRSDAKASGRIFCLRNNPKNKINIF